MLVLSASAAVVGLRILRNVNYAIVMVGMDAHIRPRRTCLRIRRNRCGDATPHRWVDVGIDPYGHKRNCCEHNHFRQGGYRAVPNGVTKTTAPGTNILRAMPVLENHQLFRKEPDFSCEIRGLYPKTQLL